MVQFRSTMLNAVSDLVIEVAPTGEILRVNRAAQVAMATGSSRRRETISTFIHDDDAAPVHAAVEAPALAFKEHGQTTTRKSAVAKGRVQ